MNGSFEETSRRAARLLKWYPRQWRSRYGEELTELLISDLTERPRSCRRTANLTWSGSVARLANAKFGDPALDPLDQARASLASIGVALAAFLAFGCTMWSQLAIGWQWSRPDTTATTTAVVVMSIAMLAFLSLALLAAMPIGWTIVRQVAQHRCHRLVVPSWLFIGGSGLLVVGARHFGNGWPGTGGRQLPEAGIIPGGLAAFVWASTLSITSYWAHPFALLSFPVAEVSWMVVSPVAIVCVAAGAAMTVRRLDLSPRALRFEARLASATCFSMAPVLTC